MKKKKNIIHETVILFTSLGIPLFKLDSLEFRSYAKQFIDNGGSIPKSRATLKNFFKNLMHNFIF